MDEPKYKRVLLKISGEALAGDKHFGLDFQVMGQVADVIKECVAMGVEIGVVIGKEGRNVPEEEGESYIYGYTIYNDWSTRDFQNREMSVNLGPGLCKDNASSLGPCIVTKDEIDDIEKVKFTVSVNGETWAETHADFYFPLKHLVYYVSAVQTIFPGDIFTTGTLPGGSGGEKKSWIQPGDVVEFSGEGIGVLRNIIGEKGAAVQLPAAQRSWLDAERKRDC